MGKYDTAKSHLAEARKRADEAFQHHRVSVICDTEKVMVWKCARPNSWTYGFFVTILPGAVLIHGDIGDLLIDRPSGHFEWVRDCYESMDYILGKSSMAKLDLFMPGDAIALLKNRDWHTQKERAAIREQWNPDDDDLSGEEWRRIVYDVTNDFETSHCFYYSYNTLSCYFALRWLFNTLKQNANAETGKTAITDSVPSTESSLSTSQVRTEQPSAGGEVPAIDGAGATSAEKVSA